MPDFALVTFGRDENPINTLTGLLLDTGFFRSRPGAGLFYSLNREGFKKGITKAGLGEKLNAWNIKLPFSISDLSGYNPGFISSYLGRVSLQISASSCIMPSAVCGRPEFARFSFKPRACGIIFRSMLIYVLEQIYTKNGINLADLDIVIIPGEDDHELYHIITLLEPHIKYASVAVPAGRDLAGGLDSISWETGMPIYASSDLRGLLKRADLVINLAGTDCISRYRLRQRSLVLNLNSDCTLKTTDGSLVINGIEYSLCKEAEDVLGCEIYEFYGRKEAADIVIAHKLGILDTNGPDEGAERQVRDEFKRGYLRFTGLSGSRGALNLSSVSMSVRA